MTRARFCAEVIYLLPNGSPMSWAVICADCDRVLKIVEGTRDEVYAEL